MKNYILLYITIVSVFSCNIYSQKARVTAADKKYDNYAYVDAIKTYERVAEKGYKSVDMFKKLGNAYYFNGELDKAAKWYSELFAMSTETDLEAEYYYRYAQSLRSIGQNDKANEMLEKFIQKSGNDSRGKLFKENPNYLEAIKANSGRYQLEDAGVNSKYSDYGTTIYSNKIVFTSARDTGSLGHRTNSWTGQPFTNLYTADLGDNMITGAPKKFDKTINSKFHEATPVFTADGKTMYFTRNNFLNGKKGKDGNDITLIKIYKASLENNTWTKITELPFDSNNYSTAHPALSPDGKTLYFASDMPGTLGQSDIFKVKINDDGSFGTPENLGNVINTEGKETFPFVNDENEIYFASDGHPGLGGLDVFVSKINTDGTFSKVQNVGADVNSPKDDFAYIIDTKSRRGYFSSNRDGGQGFDDIYKFLETKRLTCEQSLYGEVTDLVTKELLPDAKISIYDSLFSLISSTVSDEKGNYTFKVECGKMYNIRAEKTEYTTKEQKITIAEENGKTYLPIALEKSKCKVTIGDDLGKCFGIKMIYFDFDKSNIREEAAIDLEKILDVLNQNPTMKLDIRSHTDSRGTFKYNESLSDRRAKSTIKWLVKNGVDSSRLTGKGYGENQLVNKCSDNMECTEDEHQLNRRSEFIITAL
ncbi:outer membrane protein OmpA-like peptidoglycan-associated protein/tetratricopeptide (TPR) repeat protein [Flavobacterium sp. CG_23.5]|uniref:OmpA family protein n=1 Tax=Flavobacterium sp. CG_23.5 TaxID=2760708 RepID=UPI001AE52ABC|nr:OmpA family protein [Flavobacterium sp. CG_23.5]MBP2282211.1 outer membrane protein OmpA-like peptidoglycan-associated protein/tetratricopeptide (TPR) repeat protein [Flavobacterium sp. CG_23.5]